MLILLSSSARRRYRDDIVRALAHPVGSELRFRYGDEYLEPDLLADLKAGDLGEEQVLICHLANQANAKAATVIPCRFAAIARAQMVGSSCILILSAGAYVRNLDDYTLRALMTDAERALLPFQGSDRKVPGGRFAFRVADTLDAHRAPDAEEMSAFEATTESLRDAGFGKDDAAMAFYAVRDLIDVDIDIDADDRVVVPIGGRYAMRSGRRYALDVYTYSPEGDTHPSDASTLTIIADDSAVVFCSEKAAKLDSRYDLNRFRFSVEQRLQALLTGVRLSIGVPVGTDGKTVEERCDVTLQLAFAGSKGLAVARVALIAAGTVGPAAIGAYAAGKWSLGLTLVMLLPAIATGVGTVFTNLKKA